MTVLTAIGHSLAEGWWMFFDTFWALVLGFGLSGAVQAFVSRADMQRSLGDHRPRTVTKATFFGAISSSCSYAASALAKTLFARGADFTASMVFMFASTNLVLELGIVLWLLIGWQFALAEFVGGVIMIVLLVVVLPRVIPATWIEAAREQFAVVGPDAEHQHGASSDPLTPSSLHGRLTSRAGWSDAAGYTVSDLTMVRRELVIGFIVAGFLAREVPTRFWRSLFVTGHGFGSAVENALLGPFLAIISFVCSIGNVPLAAALWQGGISFGGVVAFVFADLIAFPLLAIYCKYFGLRLTVRLVAVFWAVMSVAGLATEYLFRGIGLVPDLRPVRIASTHVGANATTVLDIAGVGALVAIYWLYRSHPRDDDGGYARDPVCGMQVEISHAAATRHQGGQDYYFCSDRCHQRFPSA